MIAVTVSNVRTRWVATLSYFDREESLARNEAAGLRRVLSGVPYEVKVTQTSTGHIIDWHSSNAVGDWTPIVVNGVSSL